MIKSSVIIFLLFMCALSLGAEERAKPLLKIGEPAPVFMLKDLKDEWVSLRDVCGTLRYPWKNKTKYTVIVSFWATYCKPCEREIPELEAVANNYPNDVKVFLIATDKEGKNIVAPLVAERSYTSQVLIDQYNVIAKKYGVRAVPATFLIDKEGVLRYIHYGYDPVTGIAPMKEVLTPLLSPPQDK